jgi:hypothetical protein
MAVSGSQSGMKCLRGKHLTALYATLATVLSAYSAHPNHLDTGLIEH